MRKTTPLLVLLLACAPFLGACSSGQSDGLAGMIDQSVSKAMDRAQTKLRTEPIEVSHNNPNLPKAEITPDGDFVVGGKKVAITPAQRTALLEYRSQLIDIASQGIAIGKQGASLGVNAAGAALAGVFSGKSEAEIHKQVEAQTSGMRQAAAQICDRLLAMRAEQQKLAEVLPAFKPYATMSQKDVDDCRRDALHDDDADRAEVRESIRAHIRDGIRSGSQARAQTTGLAAKGASSATAPASARSVTRQ